MKRGVSPLIAVILLIGFLIILILLIFSWGGVFVEDLLEQTSCEIELSQQCGDISIEINELSYDGNILSLIFNNNGDDDVSADSKIICEAEDNYFSFDLGETLFAFSSVTKDVNCVDYVSVDLVPFVFVDDSCYAFCDGGGFSGRGFEGEDDIVLDSSPPKIQVDDGQFEDPYDIKSTYFGVGYEVKDAESSLVDLKIEYQSCEEDVCEDEDYTEWEDLEEKDLLEDFKDLITSSEFTSYLFIWNSFEQFPYDEVFAKMKITPVDSFGNVGDSSFSPEFKINSQEDFLPPIVLDVEIVDPVLKSVDVTLEDATFTVRTTFMDQGSCGVIGAWSSGITFKSFLNPDYSVTGHFMRGGEAIQDDPTNPVKIYDNTFTIPKYWWGGDEFYVYKVHLYDDHDECNGIAETYYKDGEHGYFNEIVEDDYVGVINNGDIDEEPPELTEFYFEQSTIDYSHSGDCDFDLNEKAYFNGRVEDSLSGVNGCPSVTLVSEDGDFENNCYIHYSNCIEAEDYSYADFTGYCCFKIGEPPSGDYYVESYVVDRFLNFRTYNWEDAVLSDDVLYLNPTEYLDPDDKAPVLEDIVLSHTEIYLVPGDVVEFEAEIYVDNVESSEGHKTEDFYGYGSSLEFRYPEPYGGTLLGGRPSTVVGNELYKITKDISQVMPSGEYDVGYLKFKDYSVANGFILDDDVDGDDILNNVDLCIYDSKDGCEDDTDDDGVLDVDDNCVTRQNSDQEDSGGESYGDACEYYVDGDWIYFGDSKYIFVKTQPEEDFPAEELHRVRELVEETSFILNIIT